MNRFVLTEMTECFRQLNILQVHSYIEVLLEKEFDHIVGLGAGRMGYALRGFVMRLNHLGVFGPVSMIGDTNVPRITKDSLVLINSSSGETPSLVLYASQAYGVGSTILTTTADPESTIGVLSDAIIKLPKINSKQLMKSVYEQFSALLFDSIVIELVKELKLNIDVVSHNHSILE